MNYKLERGLKKSKKHLIVFSIAWLLLAILFVAPVAVGTVEAAKEGSIVSNTFVAFQELGETIGKMFRLEYIGTYFSVLWKFTLIYIVLVIISIWRMSPKHEYGDIEHGSSEWCEGGEQYSVLHRKKGILLAEKNYLPVDKRGNVNVLVVGRFRSW